MGRYIDEPAGVTDMEEGSERRVEASGKLDRERERALLTACLHGRVEAYEPIVRAYQRRLYGLMVRLVGDRAASEDLVQEAFLMGFRKLDRYDPVRPFWPWLLKIGLNLGRSWLRSGERRLQPLEPERLEAVCVSRDAGEQRDRVQRLESALRALPEQGRMALLLKFYDGLSYQEMSQVLGVPALVLKMRVSRARAKLRALLEAAVTREPGTEGS